jgi:signal transduction histidine kinase
VVTKLATLGWLLIEALATSPCSVTNGVSLRSEAGRVVISVDDNGPGIPPEEREKVFAPFYRLERSRNRETGGVGLGLSVARTVAREHGGDITLADLEGAGLGVRMYLPSLARTLPGKASAKDALAAACI